MHVPSHTTIDDVEAGKITIIERHLNIGADKLACNGAKLHAVPPRLRTPAIHRCKAAITLHKTAIACRDARALALPLDGRQAGYTAAALAKLQPELHYNMEDTDTPHDEIVAEDDADYEMAYFPALDEDDPFSHRCLGLDDP